MCSYANKCTYLRQKTRKILFEFTAHGGSSYFCIWLGIADELYIGYSTYPVIRIPYQVACPRKISSYLSAFSSSFIPSPRRFVNPLKTKFITNWANPIGNRPRNVKIKNHVYQWHWTKHGWTVQLKEWNTSVVQFSKRNLLLFVLIFY